MPDKILGKRNSSAFLHQKPNMNQDKIEIQRQRILNEGFSELSKVLENYTSSVRQCKNQDPNCDATVLESLTKELEFGKLLPIQQNSYRDLSCDTLIRQIRNLKPTSLCDIFKNSKQHRNRKKRSSISNEYEMTCDVKFLLNQISDSLEQKLCGQTLNN